MAFRIFYDGGKYLVSYDTGLFLAIADQTEDNVYALDTREVTVNTLAGFNNVKAYCARIRAMLRDDFLDTKLPIYGISDNLPIRELIPVARRHEKAWRSFESLPPT